MGKLRLNWSKVGSPANPYSLKPIYLPIWVKQKFNSRYMGILIFHLVVLVGSTLSNTLFDPNPLKPELTTDMEAVLILNFKTGLALIFPGFMLTSTDQISQLADYSIWR